MLFADTRRPTPDAKATRGDGRPGPGAVAWQTSNGAPGPAGPKYRPTFAGLDPNGALRVGIEALGVAACV
jgi:hypothetical protein